MENETIFCPHCNKKLIIEKQYIGMVVQCPTCNQNFTAAVKSQVTATVPTNNETIFCLHCNKKLIIEKQYIGMVVQCPTCKQNFTAAVKSQVTAPVPTNDDGDTIDKFKNFAAGIKEFFNLNKIAKKDEFTGDEEVEITSPDHPYIIQCRKMCRKYFSALRKGEKNCKFLEIIGDCFKYTFFIIWIFLSIFKRNPLRVVKCFRRVRGADVSFLEQLDVLPRYGKRQEQLVSPAQTLYAPAIDDFKYDLIDTGDGNFEYVYSTETVTKVYTFEDQLFVYNGLWDYTVGQIVHESTDAFFFKDITNISSENEYEEFKNPRPPFDFKGNFLKITRPVAILLLLVCVGALLFHLIHRRESFLKDYYTGEEERAIESRLEKLTNYYGNAVQLHEKELQILKDYKQQLRNAENAEASEQGKVIKQNFMKIFLDEFKKTNDENKLKTRFNEIISDYKDNYYIDLTGFDLDFLKKYRAASDYGKNEVKLEFTKKYLKDPDVVKRIDRKVSKELWSCFGIDILTAILRFVILSIIFMLIKFLGWFFDDYGSEFFRKSESLTITAKSGNKISITTLCDEWLEANHGILTGQRSDGEKIIHAIRKMIEEKKVSVNE